MRQRIILAITAALLFLSPYPPTALSSPDAQKTGALTEGKQALDKGNQDLAVQLLTTSIEELPLLGDYALLWRSRAYEKKGMPEKAISDLRTLRERYADSPLVRDARRRELELAAERKGGDRDKETLSIFSAYLRDYPSDLRTKYLYASFLKERGDRTKAKELFREIYRSSSSLAERAKKELAPSDITAADLVERGESLNKAWFFPEAERLFREAQGLMKKGSDLSARAAEGLAYAVFNQKRYKEAAALYGEIRSPYWRSRALLRAGDTAGLESELPDLLKSSDKRVGTVLVAYGTRKRREGDTEAALRLFDSVISRFPSQKEEALWAKAWTHYLGGRYQEAREILTQLHDSTGESRYLYWRDRCREASGGGIPARATSGRVAHRDFYGYLSLMRNPSPLASVRLKDQGRLTQEAAEPVSERVEILRRMGLRQEVVSELLHLSRKSTDPGSLALISSALRDLGSYRQSVAIASKAPYSEDIHGILYPKAFSAEVEEAAQRSGLDPLLILSVIREESRFDPEARSIAGALGLMQLMPQTARKVAKGLPGVSPEDLTGAETNVVIGSRYLRHLVDTLHSVPLAIASYNAGEEAVRDWLRKGSYRSMDEFIEDIPYDETRNYVKKVMTSYFEYMKWRGMDGFSSAQINMGSL